MASVIERSSPQERATTASDTSTAPSHALLEHLHDAVLVLDDRGRIQHATERTAQFLETQPESLLEENALDYVAPTDRARTRRRFESLVTESSVDRARVEFRPDTDGDPVWLEAALVDATDESIDGYVATVRDVTEHRRREHDLERLHDAANRLSTADSLEACYRIAIDTAVSICGLDWCTLATPAEEDDRFEIVGVSANAPLEVGDRPFRTDEGIAGRVYQRGEATITDDTRGADHSKPIDDAIRSAVTVPVGDWGVFQAVATEPRAFDERDRRRGELLATSVRTAIDRIRRQQALEDQNERLDDFVRFVTHDLHTPLTTATGYLELIDDRIDDDVSELDRIRDAHDRIETILEQLSTWARGEDLCRAETPVALETVAERSWATVAPPSASITVDVDRTIVADRNCLQQLLENLLGNAVAHGGDDVTVTITALEDGFAVADDGPGVPVDEREAVFEPGYTSDPTGTGLGLAIVTEIVDAHGWTIDLEESADGGARFEITGVTFDD